MARLIVEHDVFRGRVSISPDSTMPDTYRVSGRAYEATMFEADSLPQALEKLLSYEVKLTKRTTPIKKSEKKSAQMKGLWEKIRAANTNNGNTGKPAAAAKTGVTGK